MEKRKMSTGVIILIIVSVIVAIIAIVGVTYFCYVRYVDFAKKSTSDIEQARIDEQESSNMNTDTSLENNNSANNSNRNNNSILSTEKEETTSSITGKQSSNDNPLDVGEWGIASRYSASEYRKVPVKISNITRGEQAAQVVKNYCDNESYIYRYEDPEEDMEWAVVEYTVDLTNVEAYGTNEKPVSLESSISGKNGGSIKYKGNIYTVSTMNMDSSTTSTENIATASFAVQLPVGCTDYVIVMGSRADEQAFFVGQ